MDSTAVVAFMAQELGAPVHTFSIGFNERDYTETYYAELAAKRWGTEHSVEVVKPDVISLLPELVRHYGEPFGDSSAIPTYCVCRLARSAVPMVLSGDGGDEALGGYADYETWVSWFDGCLSRTERPLWKKLFRPIAAAVMPDRFRNPPRGREPNLQAWYSLRDFHSLRDRHRLWRPEFHEAVGLPIESFESSAASCAEYPPLKMAQFLDQRTYLPFDILTKGDIAAMMHGLEVRTPMVDVPFTQFTNTIPPEFTLAQDSNGTYRTKFLLRRVLKRYFPATFVDRPKMGFGVPLSHWFKPRAPLRDFLESTLLRPSALIHEYFEPSRVKYLVHMHGGPRDLSAVLWLLLFLEVWLEARN
jgi:asparagine synthase (glutamine-hydrolysing)